MGTPDPPTDPGAAFSAAIAALTGELQALRVDVQEDAKIRIRKQHRITAALLVLAVVILLVLGVSILSWQIARQVRTTNARMVDCTTPGGDCYQDAQRRTGDAVAVVGRRIDGSTKAAIYAVECARLRPNESGPDFDRFLEACVAGKLAAPAPPPATPTPQPTK
jgi:hypothetical protein